MELPDLDAATQKWEPSGQGCGLGIAGFERYVVKYDDYNEQKYLRCNQISDFSCIFGRDGSLIYDSKFRASSILWESEDLLARFLNFSLLSLTFYPVPIFCDNCLHPLSSTLEVR